ncbi:MAG: hypothetical protein ACREOR_04570 [Candidatus Binatia bacterium]
MSMLLPVNSLSVRVPVTQGVLGNDELLTGIHHRPCGMEESNPGFPPFGFAQDIPARE